MATLKEDLLSGLKARIQNDVPANQFDPQKWNKTQLGLFYPANDPLVQYMRITTTLRSVFEPILIGAEIRLTESEWDTYFFSISVNSTANTAVDRLLIVAGG